MNLVLKLSGMILNFVCSPVFKRPLLSLSKTLKLVFYQDRAPYLTTFFLLLNQTLPNINSCKGKILIKCETENYIGHINTKMEVLRANWRTFNLVNFSFSVNNLMLISNILM